MKVKNESKVTQSCPTVSELMDGSPPGSLLYSLGAESESEVAQLCLTLRPRGL